MNNSNLGKKCYTLTFKANSSSELRKYMCQFSYNTSYMGNRTHNRVYRRVWCTEEDLAFLSLKFNLIEKCKKAMNTLSMDKQYHKLNFKRYKSEIDPREYRSLKEYLNNHDYELCWSRIRPVPEGWFHMDGISILCTEEELTIIKLKFNLF